LKEIDKIIKDIYKEFSGNKPGEYIDACTHCCMSEENARKLKRHSLREIPLELLKEYQDTAKPKKLNLSELKYFTPRYLELIKDFQFPSWEPLLSLNRFGYIKDSEWTEKERGLLNRFALELFKNYLNSNPKKVSISPIEILLMFQKGNFKIKPLLKEWEQSEEKWNLIHFSNLLGELKITKKGILKVSDAFSDEAFNEKICTWIESKKVKEIFKRKIEIGIMNSHEIFTNKELQELSWRYEMIN